MRIVSPVVLTSLESKNGTRTGIAHPLGQVSYTVKQGEATVVCRNGHERGIEGAWESFRPRARRRPGNGKTGRILRAVAVLVNLSGWKKGSKNMSEPSKEELLARIAELEKQAGSRKKGSLEFRVGEKGGVSVYGLGRFPVTLYYEQWVRLLDVGTELRAFLEENKSKLKLKTAE
jgi:hypothetical protein